MLLRENMVRGIGGICEPSLYSWSLSGTKKLIQVNLLVKKYMYV